MLMLPFLAPAPRITAFQQPEDEHISYFSCFSHRLPQIEREASSRIIALHTLLRKGRNSKKLQWGKMGNYR